MARKSCLLIVLLFTGFHSPGGPPVNRVVPRFRAPAPDAEARQSKALSVAILVEKDKSGRPIIDREAKFKVVFTNHSNKPIQLWSERCEPGHDTLSFRVEEGDGKPALMCKRPVDSSAWTKSPPSTIAILPKSTFEWEVSLAGFFWGTWEWKGCPEPNTGQVVTFTAILSIKPTAETRQHNVWTGRVLSQPIKALVVDASLRTPHAYLSAQCPRQALKLIQADRKWINKVGDYDCTPLHLAASYGFIEVAKWLLSHGADVNARSYNRFTPLHNASDPAIVKELLRHKPDFTARDSASCQTPLESAASEVASFSADPETKREAAKWKSIVKMLRDAGAPYDIHSAIYLNDIAQVRRLLASDKALVKEIRGAQILPLRRAAQEGRTEICKVLLAHKADPVDLEEGLGYPVLKDAIAHPAVVKLLLEAGAPADTRITWRGGRTGRWIVGDDATPLHYAAKVGVVGSARLLLDKGVQVDAIDSRGQTPLHIAVFVGHAKMVRFLLDRGADRNARTKNGKSPLDLVPKWQGAEAIANMLREPIKM
jgi:ankyrin repeat protein